MSSVDRVRVGDVLALQRRQVEVEPTLTYEEIGVRSFGRGIFHKEPVEGAVLGNKRVFRIEPGDLVISNVFGWEGAVALATGAEEGKIGSHRFMTFTARDGGIDTGWASWFFRSEPGLELIRQASPGSAGRNKTLAVQRFENLVIPLPPIAEQRDVATRLDRVLEVRESIDRQVERSARLAVAARASLTMQHARTRRSATVPLGEILTLANGQSVVRPDETYRVAGVYSFGRGLFERGPIPGSSTSYKTLNRLRAGQVVMSRLKAWEGALALIDERFDSWYLSPEFPTFDVDSTLVDPEFLKAVITAEPFWSNLGGASKGIGARRERVQAERLLEQTIDLPSREVQEQVAQQLTRLRSINERRDRTRARADALVPALLNQTFARFAA